ncbi:MAG TPA: glycosyltransferase [Planctomycetota bacterium]|nr:glycosyltransferase [Planctomycetota bacterium]
MKILIIDGPGVHPRTAARALGSALHPKGHVVIVHPIQMEKMGWFKSQALEKHAAEVLEVHQPDVVHVFSSEPWVADAFTGRGIPVVHSTLDRMSRADWVVAPSKKALARMGGEGPAGEKRAGVFPYPIALEETPTHPGRYVLAHVPKGDRAARRWITEAGALHRNIPIRFEGCAEEARVVVSLASREDLWPIGVAEAMAAGRPVIAGWNGAAIEFVLEGVTGYLSAAGDVPSLASHLEMLWSKPEEAVTLGLAGRDEAAEHFGGVELVRSLLRWYVRAGISRLAV